MLFRSVEVVAADKLEARVLHGAVEETQLAGGEVVPSGDGDAVREQAGTPAVEGLITELGVETINVSDEERLPRYVAGVLARLQEVWVGRQVAEVKSKLQRMSPVEQSDEYHALFGDLVALEAYRRSLLEQASGDDLTA